ncbi:class I SAM-dependent methyltransferase [Auraticoccus monumenti]|nr:methyltransferase domain-containing protein [Auraticoccus monumenti]
MAPTRRSLHPAGAMAWLVPEQAAEVLDLAGGSTVFARELHREGHRVTVLEREPAVARMLVHEGVTDVWATPVAVLGQPESLPFKAQRFDAVTASDTLDRFAPGLALPEIARVLRPEGTLSVVCTTRDDTVPWVRRLAATVQQVDPQAMRGDYGQQAIRSVEESDCFTAVERRDFRNWIPITRDGLLEMVGRRPAVRALDADRRQELLGEVSGLYDSIARYPEPLMLPFQSSCWRARPAPCDPAQSGDDVLQFTL